MIFNIMGQESSESLSDPKDDAIAAEVSIGTTVYNSSNEPIEGTMPFSDENMINSYGEVCNMDLSNGNIPIVSTDNEYKFISYENNTELIWNYSISPSTYLNDICYGDDKFVATRGTDTTAADKFVYYSYDGIHWILNYLTDEFIKPGIICYGYKRYVGLYHATSSSIKSGYSDDGINWTAVTLPKNTTWRSVCYGNGIYVAVAASSGYVMYSTNGKDWTLGSMPNTKSWSSVCYGNGMFVAIATSSAYAAYSTDGKTWTQTSMPRSSTWCKVCYGDNMFVAITNTTYAAYSTDGKTWTQTSMPSASYGWGSLCYGKGMYIAIKHATGSSSSPSSDGTTTSTPNVSKVMAYSTDGKTWTSSTLASPDQFKCACYGDGKFLTVGVAYNKANYANYCTGLVIK